MQSWVPARAAFGRDDGAARDGYTGTRTVARKPPIGLSPS